MVQIRESYNNFVSQYPTKNFPANSTDSQEFNELIAQRKFGFRSSSGSSSNSKGISFVNLGVYNLSPLSFDQSVWVSLDPVCLSDILTLAYKTKSKLPKVQSTSFESEISLSVLSYHSSPSGDLPILIEDEQNKKLKKIKRKLRPSATIESFTLAAVKNVKELMFIKAINNKMYDFFFSSIFQNNKLILQLYSLNKFLESEKHNNNTLLDKLTLQPILSHLSKRNQFNYRYPTIASYTANSITSNIKPAYYKQSLEEEIETAFINGFAELSFLTKYYAELDNSKFFFPDKEGGPSLFDFKLASFIYCILILSDQCDSFMKVKPEVEKLDGYVKDVFSSVL